MYQQHPSLMPSITMWSTYRYIRILFSLIILCNDAYAIVLFFTLAAAIRNIQQRRHLYFKFFLGQKIFVSGHQKQKKLFFLLIKDGRYSTGIQLVPC